MRSIWLPLGLLLGLCGCRGKGLAREDLSCVEQPCEVAAAADQCRCDPGMICEAGSCRSCADAGQCPTGVCHPSGRCEPLPCALDDECPTAEICDGGQCIHASEDDAAATRGVCGIAVVYFASDSAKLTPNNQERLTTAAPCLQDTLAAGGALVLEAHDDDLCERQYSLSSSERRAASVRDFLGGVGAPAEQIRVIRKGAPEASGHDGSSR